MAKKVKRKIRIKGLLMILLTLYLIIMAFYYIFTLPIESIIIKGNYYTKDIEIIEKSKLKKNESLFKMNISKIKKNIKELNYISDVKIKRSLNKEVIIEVKEEKILFYNVLNNTYVLSNEEEISDDFVLGVASLINYVPKDIYLKLIKSFKEIDYSIISLISEIEYDPDLSEEIIIDEERFLLKMNDGNYVYINIVNIEKLNRYMDAVAALETEELGIFYLDSSSKNNVFKTFKAIEEEKSEENELSEDINGVGENSWLCTEIIIT